MAQRYRPAPSDAFLRRLYGPLLEQAQEEVRLALVVANLSEAGFKRREIAEQEAGVSLEEMREAVGRLRAIASSIEREDQTP